MKTIFPVLALFAALVACGPMPEGPTAQDMEDLGTSEAELSLRLIGANYNAGTWNYDLEEVKSVFYGRAVRPQLRGILSVLPLYDLWVEGKDWTSQPKLLGWCKLKADGNRTTLNLRHDFKKVGRPLPVKGTEEYRSYLQFARLLVQAIEPCTDTLVVGNEPFLESEAAQYPRMVDLYKDLAWAAKAVWPEGKEPLFIGAFESPWVRNHWDPYREELLAFARRNASWIGGVDLHLHHDADSQLDAALDWVLARLDPKQQFIVTEYSPVITFSKNMAAKLDPEFRAAYPELPATLTNQDYIDHALRSPRPVSEWNDYLQKSDFLRARRRYLCTSWDTLRARRQFRRAFPTITQGRSPPADTAAGEAYDGTHWPWLLNAIQVDVTAQRRPDGTPHKRLQWWEDFHQIWVNGACN